MNKISTSLTFFYKSIFISILIVLLIIGIGVYFTYDAKIEFLFFIIFTFSIFGIPWFLFLKDLKTVFLSDKFLEVDGQQIFFNEIKSIDRHGMFQTYVVKYLKDKMMEKIKYLPTFLLPFFTHSYVKEIRKIIKENNASK